MKKFKLVSYNSPVVLSYALICLAVLLISSLTGGKSTSLLFCVYRSPFTDPLAYLRLFGHTLGHTSWEHYSANMLLFLLCGPMLEEKYGSKKILILIAVTTLATGIIHIIISPAALLGASGVVFAFIILSSFASFRDGQGIPLTVIVVAAIYLGGEIYNGITDQNNISQLAHIVGGLAGGFCGFYFNKR